MKSNNQTIKQSNNSHAGSALLVVLGMLAFMLFSGLAFSVYMRQSRLPTSFLRRTVATRQLAKAALAEVIEDIDQALSNDPHPNLRASDRGWLQATEANKGYVTRTGYIDNIWSHRIFFGWCKANLEDKEADNRNLILSTDTQESSLGDKMPYYADTSDTVPTLTLEGLAYLPPNLINEARYYSQRTPTAKWHSFWFDSGRYAYTAIDVSDYFDVNRVYAHKPRSSGNRVSLAHLFEKIEVNGEGDEREITHTGSGSGTDAWNQFMDEFRVADGGMPLISLADFNVAWGQQSFDFGGKSLQSPFYNFIKQSGVPYAGGQDESVRFGGMTFVTDSWFPTTTGNTTPNTNRTKLDLTACQPFRDSDLNGSSAPGMVTKVMEYSSDIIKSGGNGSEANLARHLCRMGFVQLWDYLDVNRVPVSLAVPTLERVPMIVGLEMSALPSIKITSAPGEITPVGTGDDNQRTVKQKHVYKLSIDGDIGATILSAYPFRKHGVDDSANFTIDGRAALFLTLNGQEIKLRPGANNAGLHLTKTLMNDENASVQNNSILSFPLIKEQIRGSEIAQNADQPVKKFSLRGKTDGMTDLPFFEITYQWTQQNQAEEGRAPNWQPSAPQPGNSSVVQDETSVSIKALKTNGSFADEFNQVATFANNMNVGANGLEVKVNAAAWVRVTYNDEDMGEKTVDLVPACVMDDKEFNSVDNDGDSSAIQRFSGEPYPLMRFDVSAKNSATIPMSTSQSVYGGDTFPLSISNPKIICNDPRYNHLPENWYVLSGNGLQEQDWITETAKMLGNDGCDNEFYLFTSDTGYMQSVYELAFLPRLTTLEQNDNWGFFGQYPTDWTRTTFGSQPSHAKDYSVMWRTYRCFASNGTAADPFDEIGLTCGENGPKVNPYSDSKKVLMAAFANTPHDWRVSATNKEYSVLSDAELNDAASFNKKHAWNAYSSDSTGKICWEHLEDVADAFKAKVRAPEYAGDWEDAFADLPCWNNSRKLIESTEENGNDSDLFSVDKKFLYGFWHDCFAARQQLFLIFVRAEPMMMGGGVSGQVPPQLGARAVALVWRDPTKTNPRDSGDSSSTLANPHRTRILFYHQFD